MEKVIKVSLEEDSLELSLLFCFFFIQGISAVGSFIPETPAKVLEEVAGKISEKKIGTNLWEEFLKNQSKVFKKNT